MKQADSRIDFKIAVILAAVLVAAVFGEGVARYKLKAEASRGALPSQCESDPVYNHVWRPSMRQVDAYRSIPYVLVTNKQRWVEEYDVAEKKPVGTFRIFYVGDSNVQGVVDTPYKMVKIVEKGLNSRSKKIKFEVINTGTSSFSILQYYLLIKYTLLKYAPDLVVLNIDMTDASDDEFYRRLARRDEKGEILGIAPSGGRKYVLTPIGSFHEGDFFPAWMIRRSSLIELLNGRLQNLVIKIGTFVWMRRPTNWLAREWSEKTVKDVDASMDVLMAAIELLKSNGVKVCLTGVPHYRQYTGEWSVKPHEVLKSVAEKERIPYLNSYQTLKYKITGTPQERFYWSNDPCHFNREGNRIWAQAQLDFLSDPENRLLPSDFF